MHVLNYKHQKERKKERKKETQMDRGDTSFCIHERIFAVEHVVTYTGYVGSKVLYRGFVVGIFIPFLMPFTI